MNFVDFGMDTASLAGRLERKLEVIAATGFSQVMISAADIVGHPQGSAAGARVVRDSGLRVTGFEALRDFEGLDDRLHRYKVDVAKSMLAVCCEVGGDLLLVEATTSTHAAQDVERTASDLHKLAILAIPLGVRIGFKPRLGSRTASDLATGAEIVFRADCPNLGLAIDSFDMLVARTPAEDIDALDPQQILLVQLSDFMWNAIRSTAEQHATGTHFRVFPGEGAHSEALAELVTRIDRIGYRGNYSFDVYNDDYLQMPAEAVAERARRASDWLGETVLRRALPVPNIERMRQG
ncbi:MAG TPA: TIM barrel protein [Casimicrobiaceae bacterium]|nr:TIM barrel protein [Casimicrobiaceae bacterium]